MQSLGKTTRSNWGMGSLIRSEALSTLAGSVSVGIQKAVPLSPNWGSNLGPSAHKADSLPLSCGPCSMLASVPQKKEPECPQISLYISELIPANVYLLHVLTEVLI